VSDYLFETPTPFDSKEFGLAAKVLMMAVWPAIGDVVVKGREAMAWLKRSAHAIIRNQPAEDEPLITWTSPSGFPATQAYFKADEHRINTRLHGSVKIVVASESEEADIYKHASGLAPNFVHSMDAAHLHRTTSQCARRGIDALAMIHDDYGTHAANAQALYEMIRQEFVSMYKEHDPILEFKTKYPETPKPPSPGSLDIAEVLRSKYFFS
jgi:DNA-directed RNA polymerase